MKNIFYKIKSATKTVGRLILTAFSRAVLVALMGIYVVGCIAVATAIEKRTSVFDIVS